MEPSDYHPHAPFNQPDDTEDERAQQADEDATDRLLESPR